MATLKSQLSSQLPIGVVTFLLAFNIVLSFTAFLGNALLLLTFYKVSSLHPAAKVLLECLAATDLCVGLFSQPLFVTALFLYIDLGNTDIDICITSKRLFVYPTMFFLSDCTDINSHQCRQTY